jgi:predicted 3-demethylubiquinone-9 3-methyltransferase (glyoxalase superfamily)
MKTVTNKINIATCLWFNKNAERAANFYAATFPESKVTAVHKAPSDYPNGKAGDVLTVEFTVLGQPFVGLTGGPEFTFDEAISFQVFTDTQEETDRYWNAIVSDGGQESVCGWCKDSSVELADCAQSVDRGDKRSRYGGRQTRDERDDDDEEDRHRPDRGGTGRMTLALDALLQPQHRLASFGDLGTRPRFEDARMTSVMTSLSCSVFAPQSRATRHRFGARCKGPTIPGFH